LFEPLIRQRGEYFVTARAGRAQGNVVTAGSAAKSKWPGTSPGHLNSRLNRVV
jgi:hypothetical protein